MQDPEAYSFAGGSLCVLHCMCMVYTSNNQHPSLDPSNLELTSLQAKVQLHTNRRKSEPRSSSVQATAEDDGHPHSVATDKPGNRQHSHEERYHGGGGERVHPGQADSIVALGDNGERAKGDPDCIVDC